MKIFLNQANENWIVDRIRKEWYHYNSETVPSSFNELDLVWIVAPWLWRQVPQELLMNKNVVCTIHHIVPENFNKQEFGIRDNIVDFYHVPNRFTEEFIKKYTNKPIKVIGYWFDPKLWFRDGKTYYQEFGLNASDYIVGSFQRDTEGSDLASPKLCKGPDLFCDYVEKLYKQKTNLKVLLSGWRRQYVINRLKNVGIPYVYKELCNEETLRRMYQTCSLYVVSSRTEGGPQALLEASAIKTFIISTDCGMARDILCSDCIIDITKEVYTPTKRNQHDNFINVQNFSIINMRNKYIKFFEEVCK